MIAWQALPGPPLTSEAERVRDVWTLFLVLAAAVGALVIVLVLYSVIRFRKRDDTLPPQKHYNVPVEVTYTAVPLVIVIILFAITAVTVRTVNRVQAEAPDVTVDVLGFQWQWQFRYPADHVTVTGASIGAPPELVLPVGETTRLHLVTRDVNHSFWVPRFLAKRDLIPDVRNDIDVHPTKTGSFDGRCAEYCGLDHWRMNFTVRVVSRADYDRWLAAQPKGTP